MRKLFADELEARLDELLFASPSHRSVSGLAEALEALPRARQELVLHWAGVAAQSHAEIGYQLCAQAGTALASLTDERFAAWVLAALDAYDQTGARAAMAVLRDPAAWAAQASGGEAARLVDLEPRLAHFLQGVSGRRLRLATDAKAWTDGETVFLPEALCLLPRAEDNGRLYTALAALLWAQVRFGTFASDLQTPLAAHPRADLALEWLQLFEAMRLEACLARELPGLAKQIAGLRGPWPEALAADAAALAALEASPADSLRRALQRAGAASPAPSFAHLPRLDLAAARRLRAARIERDSQTLRRALNALRGAGGQGRPSESPSYAASQAAPGAADLTGELAALPPAAQAAAAALMQDLGELPAELLVPAGPGAWQPRADATDSAAAPPTTGSTEALRRYDEWDYRRQAYRRDWCHLYEHAGAAGEADYVAEVRRRHAVAIRRIRRRFEALRGEDRLLKRQHDGAELDLDALVEARADRRAGAEPSPRLFVRRQRQERSLAVMFMVDMSGSTKGWVNDAEREALVMLCEAIEQLGDTYAIYGFSGWTRTRCDIYRIKGFADPYDDAVRARIAGIEAKDYTRMGVAVRHLGALLAAQPARHKLLVTLSDGRPDDFGDEYRGTHGIEDTRQALIEQRQRGIRSYCVTIDRHGADYLKRLYGPARYSVLADAGQLPLRLAEIYRRLTC